MHAHSHTHVKIGMQNAYTHTLYIETSKGNMSTHLVAFVYTFQVWMDLKSLDMNNKPFEHLLNIKSLLYVSNEYWIHALDLEYKVFLGKSKCQPLCPKKILFFKQRKWKASGLMCTERDKSIEKNIALLNCD